MKYYWINNDCCKNNFVFMQHQLKENNISHERISAQSYESIPLKNIILRSYTDINKINIANILSHIEAIKKGFENDEDYFIVIEDDIVIKKFNDTKLLIYINDFEIKNNCEIDILQIFISSQNMVSKLYYNQFSKDNNLIIKRDYDYNGTSCYLITKNGAKKILDKILYGNDGRYDLSLSSSNKLEDLLYKYCNTYILTYPMLLFAENFILKDKMNKIATNNVIKTIHKNDDRTYILI